MDPRIGSPSPSTTTTTTTTTTTSTSTSTSTSTTTTTSSATVLGLLTSRDRRPNVAHFEVPMPSFTRNSTMTRALRPEYAWLQVWPVST